MVPRMSPARVPRKTPTQAAHAPRRKLPEDCIWCLNCYVFCVQVCEKGMACEYEDSPRAGEQRACRTASPLSQPPTRPAPAPPDRYFPGSFMEASM